MTITSHYHAAPATGLVQLGSLDVPLRGVEPGALDPGFEALEDGVYNEWCLHMLVIILEG